MNRVLSNSRSIPPNSTTNHKHFADLKNESPPVTLIVLVGTAFLGLVDFIKIFGKAVVVVIDARTELDLLRVPDDFEGKLYKLPVSDEQNIHELVGEFGTQEQLDALSDKPAISTDDGTGQSRGVGGAAAKHLFSQPQIQYLLHSQIIPSLWSLGGGECPRDRTWSMPGPCPIRGSE